MAYNEDPARDGLLNKLGSLIRKNLPEEQAVIVEQFARRLYRHVDMEELNNREVMDIYGSVLSHYRFLIRVKIVMVGIPLIQ